VQGVAPVYEQAHFTAADKQGRLRLVASPDGEAGSVRLLESARIYAGLLAPGERVSHVLAPGRLAYVHVATGEARVAGQALSTGDALAFEQEPGEFELAGGPCELLLFDLPP
jgi:redox-sensitive bicupin YhaK (pirin superfamily)